MSQASQELITGNDTNQIYSQRSLSESVNSGAVEIESQRAIAEAQGQLTLAKRFPRSISSALSELLDVCKSKDFAASALYTVPNRGTNQPSIRFAEEMARVYGNFQYGHRELSRDVGKSEIEVYAWDMEKNNRSTRQITVEHINYSKQGIKKLTDPTDIDNKIANIAAKQMRGRILALVPKHFVFAAIEEIKKTISGNNSEPLLERLRKTPAAFTRFGVTPSQLEKYLGHKIEDSDEEEFFEIMGIYNALKDGGTASDYFPIDKPVEQKQTASEKLKAAAVTDQAKAESVAETETKVDAEEPKSTEPAVETQPVTRQTRQRTTGAID